MNDKEKIENLWRKDLSTNWKEKYEEIVIKFAKEREAKKELVDVIEKMIIGRAEYSEIYNLINKYKEKE
jgi:hypothetical protein